jgi:hypothetical protein
LYGCLGRPTLRLVDALSEAGSTRYRHSIEDALVRLIEDSDMANVLRPRYSIYFSSTYLCRNLENTKECQNLKDRGNPVMQLMSRFKGMSKVKGPWKLKSVKKKKKQRNMRESGAPVRQHAARAIDVAQRTCSKLVERV